MNESYKELTDTYEYFDSSNIQKTNKGKRVTVFQYIPELDKEIKEFKGILEQANQKYLVLSDPSTGEYYLLLMKYIIYIKSEEEINILN